MKCRVPSVLIQVPLGESLLVFHLIIIFLILVFIFLIVL